MSLANLPDRVGYMGMPDIPEGVVAEQERSGVISQLPLIPALVLSNRSRQ